MPVDRRDSPAAPDRGASYPSLRGRSVFITGGGSGIGGCMTEAFARQGALVAFVDIAEAPSQELVQKIEQAGLPRPWYRKTDVTDVAALQAAIRDAAGAMGDFHVLINNVASDDRHSLMEVTPEYYDARIAVNQRPALLRDPGRGARHEEDGRRIDHQLRLEFLRRQGPQHAGLHHRQVVGHRPDARARRRTRRTRIRINVITPGWIMTQRQIEKWLTPEGELEIKRNQVLPDKVRPEDVAPMALFLASDDSRACSAQEYIVDAGWL